MEHLGDKCNSKEEVGPFYVVNFLNHILFTSGQNASVVTVFCGIRCGFHVMGFDSPTDNPFIVINIRMMPTLLPIGNH